MNRALPRGDARMSEDALACLQSELHEGSKANERGTVFSSVLHPGICVRHAGLRYAFSFGALPRTSAAFLPSKKAGAKKCAPRKSLHAPLGRLQGSRQRRENLSGREHHYYYFRTSDSHRALSFSLGRRAKISEGVLSNLHLIYFVMPKAGSRKKDCGQAAMTTMRIEFTTNNADCNQKLDMETKR